MRAKAGLLFQQALQDEQGVADRARHDDGVEAGELVAGEVVVGDAAAGVEVLRVRAGVEGADRDDEPLPHARTVGIWALRSTSRAVARSRRKLGRLALIQARLESQRVNITVSVPSWKSRSP